MSDSCETRAKADSHVATDEENGWNVKLTARWHSLFFRSSPFPSITSLQVVDAAAVGGGGLVGMCVSVTQWQLFILSSLKMRQPSCPFPPPCAFNWFVSDTRKQGENLTLASKFSFPAAFLSFSLTRFPRPFIFFFKSYFFIFFCLRTRFNYRRDCCRCDIFINRELARARLLWRGVSSVSQTGGGGGDSRW